MKYKVSKLDKVLNGRVHLVSSKSISNRVLVIRALCKQHFEIKNLSPAGDTRSLQQCLESAGNKVDAGDGGTTIRFLTAYLASKPGEYLLAGSEQANKRPIRGLVEALVELGADIDYTDKEGFPPLHIRGTELTSKEIAVDANTSSQFITALLLIAPCVKGGLRIRLEGEIVSASYINMTIGLMRSFGVDIRQEGRAIIVPEQSYVARDISVEADWSAASYYYEMAAFSDKTDILLSGLKENSIQGDSVIKSLMEKFGVATHFEDQGIRLIKQSGESHKFPNDILCQSSFKHDFTDHPDLTQTMVVTCAGLGIRASITGIDHLRIKETDRILALQTELKKMKTSLLWNGSTWNSAGKIQFSALETMFVETYGDHRMAMAFAPLSILHGSIIIQDPDVTAKSYPGYWEDLQNLGFIIQELSGN